MILQGNQRGGGRNLAAHLMSNENEHVELHSMRGFIANDLRGAFDEAHAISKATKAKQYLFSLSLNPPPGERVSAQMFVSAANKAEERLGLEAQPRALIFHTKNGRMHAHACWSRIKPEEMKAVQLSHSKRKLMEVSRELFIEHGWKMPPGMVSSKNRDPRSFSLAEWQQAKRRGKDPKKIKSAMQGAWAASDSQASFQSALKEKGYMLAKGDRRGFVAIDVFGEPYAISKWVGIKVKDVRAKITASKSLPSINEARSRFATEMQQHLKKLQDKEKQKIIDRQNQIEEKIRLLTADHQEARIVLKKRQEQRCRKETTMRQSRFRRGMSGLWDRMSGKTQRIRNDNEHQALANLHRDRTEQDELINEQLDQRLKLERRKTRLSDYGQERRSQSLEDRQQFREIRKQQRDSFTKPKCNGNSRSPEGRER